MALGKQEEEGKPPSQVTPITVGQGVVAKRILEVQQGLAQLDQLLQQYRNVAERLNTFNEEPRWPAEVLFKRHYHAGFALRWPADPVGTFGFCTRTPRSYQ